MEKDPELRLRLAGFQRIAVAMIGCLRFLLLSSLLSAPFAFAGEGEGDRDGAEESFIPNYAVATSYFSWSGDADFSDAAGGFSQREAGFEANVPVLAREGYRFTAGVQYRWNQFDFSGAPGPLGSKSFDLDRVDLPMNLWKDFDRRWKMWVRLQPGWYSDLGTVNSDDFILTSLALLSYQWTDTTRVAFGGYYSRDLGEERLLPALGFIFEPNAHWSLALTFPRVELAYAPSEDLLFTARGLLSGAGWNIADPAGGLNDVDLNYKSIRVGVGVDRRLTGPWWAYIDAGIQLAQEIEITGAPYQFQQDLDNSAYVTGGVKVRF